MKRKGFTLVELLVVIAVIALLMAILMPVLRRAQDQAMRILCGNREKNLLLAFTMYADTHNNQLPRSGGYWPWDVPMNTRNQLLRCMGVDVDSFSYNDASENPGDMTFSVPTGYGGGSSGGVPIQYSDNFYCPANKATTRYRSTYWNYSSYIVAGFGVLWDCGWNGNGKNPVWAAMSMAEYGVVQDPTKRWVDRMDMPQSSERELVIDVVQCSFNTAATGGDNAKYPYGNFIKIVEGGIGIDGTNHFNTDSKASGGNMGFVDGHVEWRSWSEMKMRWRATTTGPYWWW